MSQPVRELRLTVQVEHDRPVAGSLLWLLENADHVLLRPLHPSAGNTPMPVGQEAVPVDRHHRPMLRLVCRRWRYARPGEQAALVAEVESISPETLDRFSHVPLTDAAMALVQQIAGRLLDWLKEPAEAAAPVLVRLTPCDGEAAALLKASKTDPVAIQALRDKGLELEATLAQADLVAIESVPLGVEDHEAATGYCNEDEVVQGDEGNDRREAGAFHPPEKSRSPKNSDEDLPF